MARKPLKRLWTELEDQQLRELIAAGKSKVMIALKMKRPTAAIKARIAALRLKGTEQDVDAMEVRAGL